MPNGEPDFAKDLAADALSLLLERYKGKSVLELLIRSYVDELTEARDALRDLVLARDPKTAYASWLNAIGKIVGALRSSVNDEAYRLYINAKIAQNRSSGTAIDFALIWELLGLDATRLLMIENFPAAGVLVSLDPITSPLMTDAEIIDVIRRLFFVEKANAAGVRLNLVYATSSTNAFEFKNVGDADAQANSYGNATNLADLTYGKLAGVL